MSIGLPINPGDPLLLTYLFEDGNSSLFVRSHVYDKFDVEVSGSPFGLSHIANGYFSNTAYVPDVGIYKAIYIVYEDALYTVKSRRYSQEEDMFIVGLQTSVDYEGIADAVWDELNICSEHNVATSAGWLLCSIKAIVSDTNSKINTYLIPLLALLQQVNDRVEATSIAKAVWNALRSSYQVAGTFGEALQGVITVARADLLDNLSRLDIVVSTRAGQVTVDQILLNTNTLNTKLTTQRASNLDLIDVALSTRATQASVDIKPSAAQIANAVWDEPMGDHLIPDSTGEALFDAADPQYTPSQIADAVWDEQSSGHVAAGSFGSHLDTPVTTRADKVDVLGIQNHLDSIDSAIDALPTSAGDATLAKQNDILSAISGKATQTTADSILSRANLIPINPLLTNDSRLGRIDATISSRATPADLEVIKGAGWSDAATLKAIRDAIPAPCDISTILASLEDIKGAGFDQISDSLSVLSENVVDAKNAAQSAASNSQAAYNAIASKASQDTADHILEAIGDIPTNPLLDNDIRINRLDANISTRSTQVSVDEMKGVGFNSNVHSLKNIYDRIVASDQNDLIIALLNSIDGQIPALALQTTLLSTKAAVDVIPLDVLRVSDPRLDNLDVAVSTRLSTEDFNIIKGAGFNTSNDSLFAIRQKVDTTCTVNDINSIIAELFKIEGSGFSTVADSLKAANDKAIADRNVIKADLTALLSDGEGF
jgi:hypothetical protein